MQQAPMTPTERAFRLDQADPAPAAGKFHLPGGRAYLMGNSLGPLLRDSEADLLKAIESWKQQGIDGWTAGDPPWFTMAEELGALAARLVGAEATDVVVTNSTTVNLHQLLCTLLELRPGRTAVLADALAFPSDAYALQSHLRLRGLDPRTHLRLVPPGGDGLLDESQIIERMQPDVAMIVLPVVVYSTGQLLDVSRLTREARRREILIGWDCSHSIGAIPHALRELDADFAFWCGYKYLNGGPGSAGGLFLNRKHHHRPPGLAGWFSSDKARQFEMTRELLPAAGAGRLQIGSPNILSMVPLRASMQLLLDVGIETLRRRSLRLTDFMIEVLVESGLTRPDDPERLELVTPLEHPRRGGHLTLRHRHARQLCEGLKRRGVVVDFRNPDLIRAAPAPLYNTYGDCQRLVESLRQARSELR
jgi:kynureninase